MPKQTTNLFLLEDLEDVSRTSELAESDLDALPRRRRLDQNLCGQASQGSRPRWAVCPFVPGALERKALWLAPEQIADRKVLDLVQLINGYKRLFLDAQPIDGDDADYKSIVVVFTDLSPDRAKDFFDDLLQHLGVPSYVDDGLVLGGSTKATKGLRYTTRAFDRSQRPCRFCS